MDRYVRVEQAKPEQSSITDNEVPRDKKAGNRLALIQIVFTLDCVSL